MVKYKKMFHHQELPNKKDEDVVNGAVLSLEHAYGFLNTPIYKNANFISEDTVIFPMGRHMTTLDIVS